MKITIIFGLALALCTTSVTAQSYFPPIGSSAWETVSLQELGWCEQNVDTLLNYIGRNDSKAFIVLKDGRIAIEWYADGFTAEDTWYWASAGKSVTAMLIGIAHQNGHLSINDVSSTYLGTGWTSLTAEQESKITVRHQLTMTTGLDDKTGNVDCTDPACLTYLASPGTRWAYHNAPYTLLDDVLEGATDSSRNVYLARHLNSAIGMEGAFVKLGYNQVLFSTPRSMARFGLLALNDFTWNGKRIVDAEFAAAAVNTSQNLNKSYGYLWWLNGKESFMMPQVQVVFPGPITKNAPPDAYYALGKNDQIVCVVPSEGVVFIRMGEAATPDGPPVPTVFPNELWSLLRAVMCQPSSVNEERTDTQGPFMVFDVLGRFMIQTDDVETLQLDRGAYFVVDAASGVTRKVMF
jgi:CubicO group peptidase (beta-lactamase class C family)